VNLNRLLMLTLVGLAAAGCNRDPEASRQKGRNPPTIGFIDAPAAGAVLGPKFVASGWALDESNVERVRIYLDDQMGANVPLSVMRPDVAKDFKVSFGAGRPHGFSVAIDSGARKGYCTMRFEALDGRGALTQFATVQVRIEP
jgi:hypothetical protein